MAPLIEARFGHVNVIARDWRALAGFYGRVFGCIVVPPERDYRGPDLAAGTGVPNAALRGVHLRLPGVGPDGPTLEIYQYDPSLAGPPDGGEPPRLRPHRLRGAGRARGARRSSSPREAAWSGRS